jgi:2-keto-4-pentenoate hydratase/2-oxohepta-3-ene-1,7-dioic acid hydratase in catechol pathway
VRLALFDDFRLGAVAIDGRSIVDVSCAIPGFHAGDPLGAGWWVRLCRDFAGLRAGLERAAAQGEAIALERVALRAPALNPTKIVACAANYAAHVAEMRDGIMERTSGRVDAALLDFDVFLKAPSALCGPNDRIVLPAGPLVDGKEIHHESELALVIGKRASRVARGDAFAHVLGYTIGLDITVRGHGDRTRRKSYDTFLPLGPWLTTADDVPEPQTLDIELRIDGVVRQRVNTSDMIVDIPGIVAYASAAMTLEPGDIVLTGAPPGVGAIRAGETVETSIGGLGSFAIRVAG